jgi:hypothetical protein
MRISVRRPAPATLISLAALGIALGGTSYAAATIGTAQIKPSAVTSAKIKNGSILNVDLKNGAVSAGKLKANVVTSPKIADGGVLGADLADGTVASADLADAAVTTPKLADAAVTAPRLAPAAVTPAAIAPDAVSGPKVADGTILTNDIGDGAIQAVDIKDGEVVKGRGFMFFNTLTVPDGASNVQVLNFEGLGRLLVSCAAGQTTTKIINSSPHDITVTESAAFRDTSAPADPAVKADVDSAHRASPGPGGIVAQASQQGVGGVQAVQWQLSGIDAQDVKHVATVWTTAGAAGPNCSISAQALATT